VSREGARLFEYTKRSSFKLFDETPVPIAYQLSRLCAKYICDQHLEPGDRFPAEEDIARCFDVSRPTAHRAIRELREHGYLTQERGRGTFVAHRPCVELALVSDELSFSDQYAGSGRLDTRVIDVTIEPVSPEAARALRISERDLVYRLRRLRTVDQSPVSVEDARFSVRRFPRFESQRLVEGSLMATLRRVYATSIVRCVRRLETSELLSQEIADHLGVPVLSPVFVVRGEGKSEDGEPVVYVTAYVREGVSFLSVARTR